ITKLCRLIDLEDLRLALFLLRQLWSPTLAIELRRLVALLDLLLDQRVAVFLGQRLSVELVCLVSACNLFVVEGAQRDTQCVDTLLVARALGVFDVGAEAVLQRGGGLGVCHKDRLLHGSAVIARQASSTARKYAHARYHICVAGWTGESSECPITPL